MLDKKAKNAKMPLSPAKGDTQAKRLIRAGRVG